MPNSRQTSVIASPSSTRATKHRRSSITELAFHGINTSRQRAKSVTHVSGTKCHLCLKPRTTWSVPDTWVTLYSGDMGNAFGPKGSSDFTILPAEIAYVGTGWQIRTALER